MSYDYKVGKKTIFGILSSETKIENCNSFPSNEVEFTFENGIKTFISSIYIDIVDSTKIFKDYDPEILVRAIRAFINQLIIILKDSDDIRDVGIRGDCVYAVYETETIGSLYEVFEKACVINTFIIMFNKISKRHGGIKLSAGIGLGCSKDLIIKTGKSNTGTNEYVYIGSAVYDASRLAAEASRNGKRNIMMDNTFYINLAKHYVGNEININENDFICCKSNKINDVAYENDYKNTAFYNWINQGMSGE